MEFVAVCSFIAHHANRRTSVSLRYGRKNANINCKKLVLKHEANDPFSF